MVTLAETGGAQAYVRELVPGLVGEFDVTVAAYGPGPLGEAVSERGATFVALRHVRRPLSPRDLLGIVELWRLCRRLRPDLVHLNSSKAGVLGRVAAWLARVPVRLFTAHGWAFKATGGRSATVYRWADRLVAPLTTTVICVSETELRAGLEARVCRRGRSVVIRNGVELGQVAAHGERSQVAVVSVGRLAEPKDFATLVRATSMPQPVPFSLEILGDGPDRHSLEELADALGVAGRVRFLGEVNDVAARLLRADVFVLSSSSEGLPISVLEAMATGLPVVATAVGGLPELVEDGITGFLVPPGDHAALGAAIAELVGEPERRARMGAAGRARAEAQFSIDACRSAHLELYRRLLASAAR